MKKLVKSVITLLAVGSLTACSGTKSDVYTGPKELTEASAREISSMDYVVTSLAENHEYNVNFVDGLVENNSKGELVGAVAESWTTNDDATVWTFKLRKGVNWSTSTGDVYGEVTAADFVTGIRHGLEFGVTTELFSGVIKGYTAYLDAVKNSEPITDELVEGLGVKALDDYTVEFTLETSVPYFASMTEYTLAYPINQEFLESKGVGCKIGAPDKETCEFGAAKPDSILYNGAYLLSVNDAKSQTVLVKNANYWDAEHVYLEKITRIYDEGKDPYSVIKGFEQGIYQSAGLVPTWSDYADYAEKYKDNAYSSRDNAYVFGVVFNFNRQSYEHTEHKTDAEKANTKAAILNENFRKALRAAFDRQKYLEISAPADIAKSTLRNMNNYPSIVTTSDGTPYGDLVSDAYSELVGKEVDLSDGQDPFLSKEDALAYIEKAKAEGVTFPVSLDMLVVETSDRLKKQAQSMKASVEENTDGQIVINLIMRDADTVSAIAYDNTDPAGSDYDISTFTGWGPDYSDPKTFVDIYNPDNGYYLVSMGLGEGDTDKAIKEQAGLYEYDKLYREADAIKTDLDARYAAFAKADAYLVDKAFYLPGQQYTKGQVVSKFVPFTAPYSIGVSQYKYKGIQLQEEIVTVEQYNKAYEEWKK